MMPSNYDEYVTTLTEYSFPLVIVSYVIMHLVFGITVGLTSSTLSLSSEVDIDVQNAIFPFLELIHTRNILSLFMEKNQFN